MFDTVRASVRKTARAVIVDEAPATCSAASEIAALIVEDPETFRALKAPIRRVCALPVPVPYSPVLEQAALPSRDDIKAAVYDVMKESPFAIARECRRAAGCEAPGMLRRLRARSSMIAWAAWPASTQLCREDVTGRTSMSQRDTSRTPLVDACRPCRLRPWTLARDERRELLRASAPRSHALAAA